MDKMELSESNVWLYRKACDLCGGKLIKHGFTSYGNTRFKCSNCCKTKVENYSSNTYKVNTNQNIIQLIKEGLRIRSTARILKISTTTILKRIVTIAKNIHLTIIIKGQTYEVDEMCTYIKHKRNFMWVVYALERNFKNVVSFTVGKHANKTLSRVLNTLKLSEPRKIFTDRLKNDRYLIDKNYIRQNDLARIIFKGRI